MAKLNFTASEVVPQQNGYEPKPAGDYVMQIVSSDMRTTKNGDGEYLWLEFDILSGPARGKFWDRLNLKNKNETTVRIAADRLSEICNAVGLIAVQESEQLHMKPIGVRLKITEKDGTLRNSAKYYPAAGQQPKQEFKFASAGEIIAAPAAASAAAPAAKPWERHKK